MNGFSCFRRGALRCLLAAWLPATTCVSAWGETTLNSSDPRVDMTGLSGAADEAVLPNQPARVAAARREMLEALAAFQALLAEQDQASRDGWRAYLHLDELTAALRQPANVPIRALDDLRQRMRADIVGLETDEAVLLRRAAENYAAQLRLAQPGAARRVREAAETLRRALADERRLDQAGADRVGAAVGLLEDAGYAPELVEAARLRWTYPNVWLRVQTEFVAKYVARDVSDYTMQQATILGTRTRGPVATEGRLELVTVPNDAAAQFELRMSGSTRSPGNVGRNGPAVIHSSASSRFVGGKRFYFDPVWGVADAPAGVRVNASIGIKQIDVETRVLPNLLQPAAQRVAWNKAQESQAAVRQEVQRLTGRKIAERVEAEIADPLRTVQDYYHQYLVVRPRRFDETPAVVSRSTEGFFELGMRQAGRDQISADVRRPELSEKTKLGLVMHQSLFNNASGRPLFADGVLTDEEVESYCQFVTMQVPPPLRVFSNSIPWSVAVEIGRCNTMEFDDGKIDLKIHTVRWTIGDKSFVRPIDVCVTYKVENTLLGLLFTRVGKMEIVPADGRGWSSDEAAHLQPFIAEKMGAMFQEQGRFNSLILPHGEGFGPFGEITLTQVECDDGWLVLGYQ